jgi:hypothetical protein
MAEYENLEKRFDEFNATLNAIRSELSSLKPIKNPKIYDYCCLTIKTGITVGAILTILKTYQGPPHQYPQSKALEAVALALAQPVSETICSIPYFYPKVKDAFFYALDKAHDECKYLIDVYYNYTHQDEL